MRPSHLPSAALALTALASCGGGQAAPPATTAAHWRQALHVTRVVDLTPPRADGRLVVAANGRLALLRPGGRPLPFARGPSGYATKPGPEPYIALSPGQAVRGAGCRFPRDDVYALEPKGRRPGVIAVNRAGHPRRLVDLRGVGLLTGITFDTTGRFGHRLLVTASESRVTSVFAVDCRGRARTITRAAPALEGGIVVAPPSFGRFAGQLIAPDELSGRIRAIAPSGRASVVADSGIAHGGDIGVESAGFVPRGFGPGWSAYVADRVSPGNPHPGDDAILSLGGRAVLHAGVRPGDLLVAGEGGAQTIAVRCRTTCSVTHVADGPVVAHAEGHIVFARVS
ncbi:MAG TPA: hypothetical protein VE570_10985 [Thermoleophilaceae bacterium]|nr:hypothetical protein [Thermoleophilaceae bacterium]